MLKQVAYLNGIVNKQVVLVEGKHNIYILKEDIGDKYAAEYVEVENCLFYVGTTSETFLQQFNPLLLKPNILKFWETSKKELYETGKTFRIHKGELNWAGITDEEILPVAQYSKSIIVEKRNLEEMAKLEIARLAELYEKEELLQNEKDFMEGQELTSDRFIALCKKYEVVIPIKTLGWMNKNLVSIGKTTGKFYGKMAKNLFSYTALLEQAIKQKDETVDPEILHLLGK